ncbi:hypothetical protein BGP_4294 [Beggiatoa sp. PS]|nr:hypothetical protein BGP_4294 [Beggiatoa sp. PS]
MKVVVYTAETEVPFDEFYKPLGSWKKIIFSNKKQFDERAVKSLLEVTDFEDDITVFYVPMEMKDMFLELLKKLFKIDLKEEKNSTLKDSLGLIWEKFSQFYDEKLKIQAVLTQTKTNGVIMSIDTSGDNPQQNKMDQIVNAENEIDAIFVANVGTEAVIAKSKVNPQRQIDGELMDACLSGVKELEQIKDLGKGELDYALFQLKEGVVCMSIVPGSKPKMWLGFISATPQGANRLLHFREKFLDELHELVLRYN